MKTGEHLKVLRFGGDVMGVRLHGDPRRPEPGEFRVYFPGGSISVVRTELEGEGRGDYWAHVNIDHPDCTHRYVGDGVRDGWVVDGRVDVIGVHASDCDQGDLDHEYAYHVAVRVRAAKA